MEFGPKNHNGDGLLGPNSIMVVYMDPLGKGFLKGVNMGSMRLSHKGTVRVVL